MADQLRTLVDMINLSVQQFPQNRVFGTKKDGVYSWITYAELGAQVDAFRGGLASLGVKPGDRVAIIANNRVEWAVAAYATYQLGASFAPMYESQTAEDWGFILRDCQPTVLVVSRADLLRKVLPVAEKVSSLRAIVGLEGLEGGAQGYDQVLAQGRAAPVPVSQVEPTAMAGLIYTSGTTGKPKGVMLSHANFISNVNALHEIFHYQENDVSLAFLPWAHSFGQTVELHGMISCGAALGIAERVDTIIDNLSEVRPTILFSVPRIFNRIYDGLNKKMAQESFVKRKLFYSGLANSAELKARLARGEAPGIPGVLNNFYDKVVFSKVRQKLGGNLRFAISGGAALSKEVAQFISYLNITVFEGYGLSETSPIVTANYPGNIRIGSIGKPIPEVRVELDTTVESGDPTVGELINYGPNTMMGYYNAPEETAKVMTPDGGFRTGDLGRRDADGFVYITGRVKEQYKLENGKYVAPAPLEEQLQLSPYILQAMIYGDNRPGNVALLVPDIKAVQEWAQAKGLAATAPAELVDNPQVRELIAGEIQKYSTEWKSYERPRAFRLLTEEWTQENDMLTPKMSLKRRNVVARYRRELESLFKGEE